MRTYKLYLIRHGLTEANFDGRYIGSTDLDLCEQGIAGLLSLKKEYEYPNVGRIYASPLKRCVETARLLYPEMQPVTVGDLREYDFGEFENKTATELAQNKNYRDWLTGGSAILPPGAEQISVFEKRIVRGLDSILRDMMKDKVADAAVVTHAGVIATLLAKCGLPKRRAGEWDTESGKGYTLLVNTSLWAGSHLAEVFTPVPYGWKQDMVMLDYQKETPDGE